MPSPTRGRGHRAAADDRAVRAGIGWARSSRSGASRRSMTARAARSSARSPRRRRGRRRRRTGCSSVEAHARDPEPVARRVGGEEEHGRVRAAGSARTLRSGVQHLVVRDRGGRRHAVRRRRSSGASWLPVREEWRAAAPRPRMRSKTSTAPGWTCISSPARWTSVPSTSKTNPFASSRRSGATPRPARRLRPRSSCTAGVPIPPGGASQPGCEGSARRRSRRPVPRASSGGGAAPRRRSPAGSVVRVEVQRLERAELLDARAREHAVGDVRGRPGRRLAVVAEEVADRLDGDVRPALARRSRSRPPAWRPSARPA
jgi:hypothetical protein